MIVLLVPSKSRTTLRTWAGCSVMIHKTLTPSP